MNAFRLFAGKTPERIEQSGDAFFEKGELGAARLEYEKALDKLKRKTPDALQHIERVEGKIVQSGNALALKHRETADDLADMGDYEEAEGHLEESLRIQRKLKDNDPGLAWRSRVNLAIVYRERGQVESVVRGGPRSDA